MNHRSNSKNTIARGLWLAFGATALTVAIAAEPPPVHVRGTIQTVAAVYRGDVASGEHCSLPECALKRDWMGAQRTLTKHVNDCVKHMIDKRLIV